MYSMVAIWGHYQDTNDRKVDFISAHELTSLTVSYCVFHFRRGYFHFRRGTTNVLQNLANRPIIYTIFKFLRWYPSAYKRTLHGCICPSEGWGWVSLLRIPSHFFILCVYHSIHSIPITVYFMLSGINPLPLIYWNIVDIVIFFVCVRLRIYQIFAMESAINGGSHSFLLSRWMPTCNIRQIICPRGIAMRNHTWVR